MPVTTIFRPEFAECVSRILDRLTSEQAAIRTGISSEYIRKMRKLGLVPSETILEKFARGMIADLHALRVAGGYESDERTAECVREEVAEYLIDRKGMDPDEVETMWKDLAEA